MSPRPAPRVPRTVARRIDRLARRAHAFHRFAHHPLCTRYAGEVIRIGRTRLCRGCSYALAGGLAGGVIGLVLGSSPTIALAALAASSVLLAASLWIRPPKTVTRLVPAALAAVAITCGVQGLALPGLAIAALQVAIIGGLRLAYGRRGPDRTPCTTCPERDHQPCSGLRPILSRERAFQRVAASMADQAIRRSAISSGDGPRIEA